MTKRMAFLIVALWTVLPSDGHAGVTQVGGFCNLTSTAAPPITGSGYVTWNIDSNHDSQVECPIAFVPAFQSMGISDVYMTVTDGSTTASLSCTLSLGDNITVRYTSTKQTSVSGTGQTDFHWTSIPSGYYYGVVVCTLPRCPSNGEGGGACSGYSTPSMVHTYVAYP